MSVIQLHGPPLLQLAGDRTLTLSAREAALLAWLHLEGPTPRGAIAGQLWPGGDESKARANLRQLLLRLKRAAGGLLLDEKDGVLSLSPAVQVAAASGRLLGPLEFDDAPDLAEWLDARRDAERREQLRERLAAARRALDDAGFDAIALDTALTLADDVLHDDPAVEEAHRIRMEVFFRRDDRASAIDAWDGCRHALRQAYGITPSAATNELGRRILVDVPTALPKMGGVVLPAMPQAFQRPAQLIGREGVMSAMSAAQARDEAILLTGPGGMGKSRVLSAMLLQSGQQALIVSARPGDAHLPGSLASRLLRAAIDGFDPVLESSTRADIRRLLPGEEGGVGPALRSALEQRRVLSSVASALSACQRHGLRLIAIDDLQYADSLSLEALGVFVGQWLATRSGGDSAASMPLPWFSFRSESLSPAGQNLVQLLEGSRHGRRVELLPLSVEEVVVLLGTLPLAPLGEGAETLDRAALARTLHAQVGGNPAFLLELLRSLWREDGLHWQPGQALALPDSLLGSIRQRLAALSPAALHIAQLAAVAGQDFSLALAALASGRAPLELAPVFAELDASQVLAGTGFVHDLMAEAVRRSLPSAMVPPLHALVADHLAAHNAPPQSVAHHRSAAGDAPGAAPWWLKAAERARAGWRMAEAAEAFEQAARAWRSAAADRLTRDGIEEAASRLFALRAWRDAARCWLNLSRQAEAAAALAQAEGLIRSDTERLMVRAIELTLLFNAERYGEAAVIARELARSLPVQQALLDDDELTQTLLGVALAAPYVAAPRELLVLIESFAPRGVTSPRLAMRLALCAGMVLNWLGEPLAAQQRFAESEALARAIGSEGERINLGNQRARSAELRGDLPAALGICYETLAIVKKTGAGVGLQADLLSFAALLEAATGGVPSARRLLGEVEQLAGESHRRGYLGLRRVQALLHCGELLQAEAELAALTAPAEATALGAFRAWCEMRLRTAQGASPWSAWADAARHIPGGEGQMPLRQRLMQLGGAAQVGLVDSGWPDAATALSAAETLIIELQQRGLRGMERLARQFAAAIARQAGDERMAAGQSVAADRLAPAMDCWGLGRIAFE